MILSPGALVVVLTVVCNSTDIYIGSKITMSVFARQDQRFLIRIYLISPGLFL